MTLLSAHFLSACAVLAAAVAVCAQNAPVRINFPERPSSAALANVVRDNFIGISWELSAFDTLWGNRIENIPNAMLNYMSNFRKRITRPLRIRIGGSGMDGSTYDPDLEPMLKPTNPDAYFNDVPVDFGPTLFKVMNAVADRVGEMEFIIGLSMRNVNKTENVIELATAARQYLGDRLDALILGNEPDLYDGHGEIQGYTLPRYITDLRKVIGDLHAAPAGDLLDRTLLAGPTTCCNKWPLAEVFNAGMKDLEYKYYTLQHYPKHACQGPNADNTNMTYYLAHSELRKYTRWDQAGVSYGQELGVPVILTEYNTVSCGGTNISSTFAASMWAIDAGLQYATNNFSAIFIHTREFDIQYNLFDPPTPTTFTKSGWRTGSPYYSVLLLTEVFSSTGSVVVDLNLDDSLNDDRATASGYGIYDNAGQTRGKLVLFNRADAGGTLRPFNIPANVSGGHPVGVRILRAPSIYEKMNITWAGQTIGPTGELQGGRVTEYMDCADGCAVQVPGPGVALVYLNPNSTDTDNFFEGNSTITAVGEEGEGHAQSEKSGTPSVARWSIWISAVAGTLGMLSIL